MNKNLPPATETILLERASNLAGKSIANIAESLNTPIPQSLTKAKGWMGELLEAMLGTDAGNKAAPDFTSLGIELKTLPIASNGKPLESTYITTLPLMIRYNAKWECSEVYFKLKRILWIPIISERAMSFEQRRIAHPFIWSPSAEDMQILKNDWQEIMDMVMMGEITKLSGRFGNYLHIRPKAANSRCLTHAYDIEGNLIKTLPRGFYLRTQFTEKILREIFG